MHATTNPRNKFRVRVFHKEFEMKKIRQFPLLILGLLLALILAGCAAGEGPLGQPPALATPTPAAQAPAEAATEAAPAPAAVSGTPEPGSPEEAALRFFEAYTTALHNWQPTIEDPNFAGQPYLSAELLKQVSEIRSGFEGPGFDPILQAQDIPPGAIEIGQVQVEDEQATVTLLFGRGLLETPWERTVSLEKIAGQWQVVPDRVENGGKSPTETVQAFYDWYLGYIGSGENFRNPLADRAYRAAPYLAPRMIQQVDSLADAGLQYDPFLCAQDIPADIHPVASFYNHGRPVVVMGSSFSDHYLVADLMRTNFNWWAIANVTCGSEPHGFVKAFYTWLLDYSAGSGELRNPWVDGAYRDSGFLNQDFIQELDRLIGSDEPLMADPVLLAQDLPQAINTRPCPEQSCALLDAQYGEYTIRQLQVALVEEEGHLRIAGVSHPEAPESPQPSEPVPGVETWIPFVDEPYGYSLRFPAGWQVDPAWVTDLHTPSEDATMRQVLLYAPEAVSERIPFQISVLVGDETALASYYMETEKVREQEINGYTAWVYRSEPGLMSYVFPHPFKEQVWVILTDPIGEFAGREALAATVQGGFPALLSTIAFSR